MKRLPNVRCRCIDHVRHSFLNLSSSAVNWVGLEKPYKGRFIFVSKRFKRRCRLTQFVVLKNKLSATPAAWPVFLITTIVLCGVLVSAAVDVSHILIWWLAADDNKHCVIQTLASASSACCCAVSLATKIAVCSACLRCKVLSVWRNCCVFCMHKSQNIYKRNDFKHNHWNRGRTLDTQDDNLYSGYQYIYPLSHWVLLSTSPGLSFNEKCYPPFEQLRPWPSLNSIELSVVLFVRFVCLVSCHDPRNVSLIFWLVFTVFQKVNKAQMFTLSRSISSCLFVASRVDTFSDNSFICSQALLSSDSSCAVLFSRFPRILLSNSKAVDALVPLWLAFESSVRRVLSS